MSGLLFTGERHHSGSALFAIDIVRHRAAYAYAIAMAQAETSQRILDLGCGTGYGTSELAEALPQTFAVDRIPPRPLSTSDAADELPCVDRGGRRTIKQTPKLTQLTTLTHSS